MTYWLSEVEVLVLELQQRSRAVILHARTHCFYQIKNSWVIDVLLGVVQG